MEEEPPAVGPRETPRRDSAALLAYAVFEVGFMKTMWLLVIHQPPHTSEELFHTREELDRYITEARIGQCSFREIPIHPKMPVLHNPANEL